MKVYTHYYPIINSTDGFRWRTILQFGKSFDIIGSVVMKNPGSANFLQDEPISDQRVLDLLQKFDNTSDKWYEFKTDQTMLCVGDLFAEYYDVPNRECLNGVIQIFNLFYIKEADLGKALLKNKTNSLMLNFQSTEDMTAYDLECLKAPIYLGFSDLAWHKDFTNRAKLFYNAAKENGMFYLDDFNNNPYFHPLYLMRQGKNTAKGIIQRMRFKQNSLTPIGLEDALQNIPIKLSKAYNKQIAEKILHRVSLEYPLLNNDRKRYAISDSIGITIAEGMVSFRHINYKNGQNYQLGIYPNTDEYRDLFSTYGYSCEPNVTKDVWLSRKSFIDFGNTEDDIIHNIIEEVAIISKKLKEM